MVVYFQKKSDFKVHYRSETYYPGHFLTLKKYSIFVLQQVFRKDLVDREIRRTIKRIEGNKGKVPSCDVAAYSPSHNPQDYYNAKDAIEKYCTQNDNGDYEIGPDYLFAIKASTPRAQATV